jgi:hypothetical protein
MKMYVPVIDTIEVKKCPMCGGIPMVECKIFDKKYSFELEKTLGEAEKGMLGVSYRVQCPHCDIYMPLNKWNCFTKEKEV